MSNLLHYCSIHSYRNFFSRWFQYFVETNFILKHNFKNNLKWKVELFVLESLIQTSQDAVFKSSQYWTVLNDSLVQLTLFILSLPDKLVQELPVQGAEGAETQHRRTGTWVPGAAGTRSRNGGFFLPFCETRRQTNRQTEKDFIYLIVRCNNNYHK